MKAQVLRFVFELSRTGARLTSRQQGIDAIPLTLLYLATVSLGARFRSAPGQAWRWGAISSQLLPRRGTVRPNNSFKPTPLRGSA